MKYISESDATERYNDFLDEVYAPYEIAGTTLYPSRMLKETDPIAYDVSFNDWLDGEGLSTDETEADEDEEDEEDISADYGYPFPAGTVFAPK